MEDVIVVTFPFKQYSSHERNRSGRLQLDMRTMRVRSFSDERPVAFFLRAHNARRLAQAARPGDFCHVVLEIGSYVSAHGGLVGLVQIRHRTQNSEGFTFYVVDICFVRDFLVKMKWLGVGCFCVLFASCSVQNSTLFVYVAFVYKEYWLIMRIISECKVKHFEINNLL